MSIKLMTLAFQTPYKPTPKIILLSLCDFSNDKGLSFPSLRTQMDKASVSKPTLLYVLSAFEKIKLISREKRKRTNGSDKSSLYFIQVKKLQDIANIEEISDDRKRKDLQKKYLSEYENAYRIVKHKGNLSDLPKNVNKKTEVTTRGHSVNHLEPSINHQEKISKDISSSKNERREDFSSFRQRIKNNYCGKPLIRGPKGFLESTMISVSLTGYLFNNVSNRDLSPEDAKALWAYLYSNPTQILAIKDKG